MRKQRCYSTALQTLLLFIFAVIIFSCTDSYKKKTTKHYSEESFSHFKQIADKLGNRDSAFYLADSLYATFPSISAADKYRLYDFKRHMFELIRYNDISYDTAITYADSMIYVIEDKNLEKEMQTEYLKAFTTRADFYTRRKRYNDAIKDLNKCKQIYELTGDSCQVAENSKTLAYIAINQSDFPLAAKLLKEAINYSAVCKVDEAQFTRMQRYLDDLGYIYSSHKQYDSSIIYHLKAINYINENRKLMAQDTLFLYRALENIYGNIGVVYSLQNNLREAEFYAKKAIEIDRDILQAKPELAAVQCLLGRIFLKQGKVEEADKMAKEADKEADKFDLANKNDLYDLKAKIAKAKNQFEDEAKYLRQFILTKDTIYRQRLDLLKKNPFLEYERLDKKYQVELLKKDNRIQQNKTTAAIAISILLTLIAAVFLYFLRQLRIVMKKRAVAYKKLAASELELKETMAKKEFAEKLLREKELFAQEIRLQMEFNEAIIQQRRQISDDMHDELSSSLAALKFYATDIKDNMIGTAAEAPLKEITEEINSVYQNARHYMHQLKSNNWETKLSLTGFLKEIQQKFTEKNLLEILLDIDEKQILENFTIQQHDHLYHILKEAISNVIKHASTTVLKVYVGLVDTDFHFTIADYGKGFNKETVNYGMGIASMTNRIKELKGIININTSDKGTTISGQFPTSYSLS